MSPRRRLTSSPSKLAWVPDGMDPTTACRVWIRVAAYVDESREEYHVTEEIKWILDKDTTCFIDLMKDLDAEIKRGSSQDITVTFWDKINNRSSEIASDSALLDAFEMYWDSRKLQLQVVVSENESSQPSGKPISCVDQSRNVCDAENTNTHSTQHVLSTQQSQIVVAGNTNTDPTQDGTKTKAVIPADPWGEFDEVEYVGVNDEREKYNDLVSDDEANDPDYVVESDSGDEDDLEVSDVKGCDYHTHVTDIENPKIDVGVTFEDGDCFKRCIRQYAVLKEVELAVPYSESTRYRAYCKSKRCNWKIHASRLQDGKTWMVCPCPKGCTCKAWQLTVDLNIKECTCKAWQLTGLPCTHAISFIGSLREIELDDFVHGYYSVDMFKKAYASWVCPLPDKSQWEKVDMGFKLWPPILKRAAGRPRTRRIFGVEEGGSTRKKRKCKRCGGFGHLQKTCNEPVYEEGAPPPPPPKPKRVRKKKNKALQVTEAATSMSSPSRSAAIDQQQLNISPGPMTRNRASIIGSTSPVATTGQQKNISPGAVTRKRALIFGSSSPISKKAKI